MKRRFKELLDNDELVRVFCLGRVVHPIMIEMFGLAGGYHGFWLDWEHSEVTTEQIVNSAITARANDFDCFVRIPPVGYWKVTHSLDSGAGGVMASQIHSAAQAKEFVSWTKFPPEGVRGLHSDSRDGNYTYRPVKQFVEQANRDHLVAIQIETLGSVKEAEEIAAIDGVDMLFVGPSDLSLALGHVGEFHHEKLWEAIDYVAEVCRKHGKHWGTVPPDAKFADRAVENGCRMLTLGNGMRTLRMGIEALQENFEKHF